MTPDRRPRSRRALLCFVAAYLAVQLILPLRGLLWTKLDTRGDFSWNMYADRYACSIAYTAHARDGTLRPVDFEALFRNEVASSKVMHRDVLPDFHAWLCREATPKGERLHALFSCRLNDGAWTDLVDPTVDLCTTPSHGVR